MKKFIIILLSTLILVVKIDGKNKETTSYVYSTAQERIRLISIERSDSATTLAFEYRGMPNERFFVPTDLFLDDSNHRRYKLIHAEGIVPGQSTLCPITESVKFSLVFEPLSRKETHFDLLPLNKGLGWFAFWGIHKTSDSRVFVRKHRTFSIPIDSVLASFGKVYIKAEFTDKHPKEVRLKYSMIKKNRNDQKAIPATYSDGEFESTLPIEGVSWSYLCADGHDIPVYLIPGDSIRISISDVGGIHMKVTYKSMRGKDLHSNLMYADPLYVNAARWVLPASEAIRPSTIETVYEKMRKEEGKLRDYLTWKYNLTEYEAHLLERMMYSKQIDYLGHRLLASFQQVYPPTSFRYEKRSEIYEVLTQPEFAEYLSFLRDIDMEDMGIFIAPYQKAVWVISDIVGYIGGLMEYEEKLKLIEFYSQNRLSDIWKERLHWALTGK